MTDDAKVWKSAASAASVTAAVLEKQLRDMVETGDALLSMLPEHWHDDATVNFRDAVMDSRKLLDRVNK